MRIESILASGKLIRPSIESDDRGHYVWVVTVLTPEPSGVNDEPIVYRGICNTSNAGEALEIAAGVAREIATKVGQR